MISITLLVLITFFLLLSFRLFGFGESYHSFEIAVLVFILIQIIISFVIVLIEKVIWIRVLAIIHLLVTFCFLHFKSSMVVGYSYDIVKSSSNSSVLNIGDIVISRHFNIPKDRFYYVGFEKYGHLERKMIVAVPGDFVEYCENRVSVRNARIEQFHARTNKLPCTAVKSVEMSRDEYFVVGYNFDNSRDSRFFGPIRDSDIVAVSIYKVDVRTGKQYSLIPNN